jgi:hypothetical protein
MESITLTLEELNQLLSHLRCNIDYFKRNPDLYLNMLDMTLDSFEEEHDNDISDAMPSSLLIKLREFATNLNSN